MHGYEPGYTWNGYECAYGLTRSAPAREGEPESPHRDNKELELATYEPEPESEYSYTYPGGAVGVTLVSL